MIPTELITYLVVFVPVAVIGYTIYSRKRYKVRVFIFEKRAGGYTITHDRAGRRNKNGAFYYKLQKKNENTKPSAFDRILQTNKGLHLNLWSPGPGEYYPMDIVEKRPVFLKEETDVEETDRGTLSGDEGSRDTGLDLPGKTGEV